MRDMPDMKKILDQFPPEPAGVEQWIRKSIIRGRYIIFNNKEEWAVCTHCGTVWRPDIKMKHNSRYWCPNCKGQKHVAKAAHFGRGKLTEYFRILTFAREGRTVYARLWEIDVDFSEPDQANIRRWLSAAYIINAQEQHYYKHHPGYYTGPDHWCEVDRFNLPSAPKGMSMYYSKYELTMTYRKNLKGIFNQTDLKYLMIPGVTKLEAKSLLVYMGLGLKYQSVELLAKAGFRNVIGDRIDGCPCGMLNWKGKDLQKILRLPRRHIRYLQQHNPTLTQIRIFQQLSEEEKLKMPWGYVEYLARHSYRDQKDLRAEITDHAPLLKTLQYLDEQGDIEVAIGYWEDYIRIGKKLGMDFKRKKNLYPEDLEVAHNEVVARWHAEKDAMIDKGIREHAREEQYSLNGLLIVPAMSQEALNLESAELQHCVKTYGDRIARGSCWIWLIRKAEEPDKPFYTMETDTDGHMIQCRGKSNCSMTEEVKAFAEGFEHHLQKELEKERASAS